MSDLPYLALWLASVLAVVALLSAALTRHLRLREERHVHGLHLLELLARYSAWVASQRRGVDFDAHEPNVEAVLAEAQALQARWFPRLAQDWGELMRVHRSLGDYLAAQQRLRLSDPEAWLETDHDAAFMAHWRAHRLALHALAARLQPWTGWLAVAETA